MTPELPPLPGQYAEPHDRERIREARERILLAYIASLEAINENNLAEAAARIADLEKQLGEAHCDASHYASRNAELEAVLVRFDERWLMDGELGFCAACGVSIEGGESHKPECWLSVARAAIDAARGKE